MAVFMNTPVNSGILKGFGRIFFSFFVNIFIVKNINLFERR